MSCETCRHFFNGNECRRYPTPVPAYAAYRCGEWQQVPPTEMVLQTEVTLLQTCPHTRRVCQRLGIKTVQDLLDLGRSSIVTNGAIDRVAINQIAQALSKIGITW